MLVKGEDQWWKAQSQLLATSWQHVESQVLLSGVQEIYALRDLKWVSFEPRYAQARHECSASTERTFAVASDARC
jgi:hypothetical protein